MNFNRELYLRYKKAITIHTKDGVWSVTTYPNGLYCPAIQQKLGFNGLIPNHHWIGTRFRRKVDGKIYTVDGVNVHYWSGDIDGGIGYYYYVALVDDSNSHHMVFYRNINCESEYILKFIEDFQNNYEML